MLFRSLPDCIYTEGHIAFIPGRFALVKHMYMSYCTFAMSDCISQMPEFHFGFKLVVTYPTPSRKVTFMSIPRLLAYDADISVNQETDTSASSRLTKRDIDQSVNNGPVGGDSVTSKDQSIAGGVRQYSVIKDAYYTSAFKCI